jgi:hypothetical protein
MANFRGQIRKLAKRITKLHMKEIQDIPLVDTGNLLRSFTTKINVDKRGGVKIDVSAIYYFKYLNEPYSVSEAVLKSKEYKKIESDLFALILAERFIKKSKEFKSNESVEYTFKIPRV